MVITIKKLTMKMRMNKLRSMMR